MITYKLQITNAALIVNFENKKFRVNSNFVKQANLYLAELVVIHKFKIYTACSYVHM